MEKLMQGVYILVMELRKNSPMRIGSLGIIDFRKGFYAYTGSAMGGLEQRIKRHLRKEKKLHWHIDYLLQEAEIKEIQIKETDSKQDERRTEAPESSISDHRTATAKATFFILRQNPALPQITGLAF